MCACVVTGVSTLVQQVVSQWGDGQVIQVLLLLILEKEVCSSVQELETYFSSRRLALFDRS